MAVSICIRASIILQNSHIYNYHMKILFVGYAVPASLQNEFDGLSIAGNKMQLGLINALKEHGHQVSVVTIPPLAPFPRGKFFYYHERRVIDFNGVVFYLIGFLNYPIIKQIQQVIMVFIKLLSTVERHQVILTFNAFPQVSIPVLLLKYLRSVKFIPILADLPIDDLEKRRGVSKILRSLFDLLTRKSIIRADKIIVLNERAAKEYGAHLPYLCIEGGVDWAEVNRYCAVSRRSRNLVYTGALTAYSGIREIIAAMQFVSTPDVVLEIYGSGPLENEVSLSAKKFKNIKFLGKKTHSEILKIQSDAWLLVNPRSLSDPIGAVTFPSKIYEYMLSSTPIVTTRLASLGEKYSDLMYFFDKPDPRAMASKLDSILMVPEFCRRQTACRAFTYVVENKIWINQASAIADFIGLVKPGLLKSDGSI